MFVVEVVLVLVVVLIVVVVVTVDNVVVCPKKLNPKFGKNQIRNS